mgnify:CR=1 FL=1
MDKLKTIVKVLDEKLAENRFLQLLKYKNGQQLYDKKNKNTKA